jgi:hypothetical protein
MILNANLNCRPHALLDAGQGLLASCPPVSRVVRYGEAAVPSALQSTRNDEFIPRAGGIALSLTALRVSLKNTSPLKKGFRQQHLPL